ncbi:MAG: amino acid ABC transporter ATP-binding protein [Christensenellales bacterium]|jgi:ABC-type polar amino acid transport system ATPase subunit
MLKATDIKKNFGKLEVLKGVDLFVNKGDVIAIIGPSGSGKSTLLRCINLLEEVNGGSLEIDGEYIFRAGGGKVVYADSTKKRALRKKLGMVFQDFNLFPHLSVMQNLMLAPMQEENASKQAIEDTCRSLLNKVGLSDKEKSYPCELSGGQQQRVAIARALALKPEVLCFDEPTSALDPELTGEVLSCIKQLANEHMTMVVVTHEMGFAGEVANEVLFMDNGIVVEMGTPDEVLRNPKQQRTKDFMSKLLTI